MSDRFLVTFRAPLPIGCDSEVIYANSALAAVDRARAACKANGWELVGITDYERNSQCHAKRASQLAFRMDFEAAIPTGRDSAIIRARSLPEAVDLARDACSRRGWRLCNLKAEPEYDLVSRSEPEHVLA